ncbi:MAG: hypothetical protein LC750_05675 [Actinobacteria bacterium]|nr:hypothetical protein [Actinomycetota bacterium]
MRKLLLLLSPAFALVALAAGPAFAEPAQRDVSPVFSFATGTQVGQAWSSLSRTASGVTMTLHTTDLTGGHAVTVWWVVFNDPQSCSHGALGVRCGPGDLSVPATQASILYAAGHVIGGNGVGDFGAQLSLGKTDGALFGQGLTNAFGADVHLVVRDHGPVDQSLMPGEIHSFDVCNTGCANVQHSQHESD